MNGLVAGERILEVELAMLEGHGLTLPLVGMWRNEQTRWRHDALYDAQRARAKRQLLRWVRRLLTLGLWWK